MGFCMDLGVLCHYDVLEGPYRGLVDALMAETCTLSYFSESRSVAELRSGSRSSPDSL